MEAAIVAVSVAVGVAVIAGLIGVRVGGMASRAADRERARVASDLASSLSSRMGEISHSIARDVQAAVVKEVAKVQPPRERSNDVVTAAVRRLEAELSRVVRPRLPVPSALADEVVAPPRKFVDDNPLIETVQPRRCRQDPDLEKTQVYRPEKLGKTQAYRPGQLKEALRAEPCAT